MSYLQRLKTHKVTEKREKRAGDDRRARIKHLQKLNREQKITHQIPFSHSPRSHLFISRQ